MAPFKRQVIGLDKEEQKEVDTDIEKRKDGWLSFTFYSLSKHKVHIHGIAKYCPLVAATLAPLSTLLDIPALTQHWYSFNGVAQKDPNACLALSAVGLCLNVLANLLLLVRFSFRGNRWWNLTTRLSLASWVGKTLVAVINLIIFGILTRNSPGYSYVEGFWCAVVSVIDSGIISVTLLIHYFFAFGRQEDSMEVRREGKRFMLSVTLFISILAIQSLAFCKIEKWAYSDAIYFSVQTALTIGFGDFTPTTTAGKILVFIFSILTISQLGNEIALIITFISGQADKRRDRWRRLYEGAMHREAEAVKPKTTLIEEMALIHEINQREEMMSQMYDLLWSAFSLIAFWLSGAAIFSTLEGWTYGNTLYFVMVLSLTIGLGDFHPITPPGKVVFVVYALMAVPIVTSFAVQTITGLLSTFSERGTIKERFKRERKNVPEAFKPHAEFILRAHESYSDMRDRLMGDGPSNGKWTPNGDDTLHEEPSELDDESEKVEGRPREAGEDDPAIQKEVKAEFTDAEQKVRREYNAAEDIVRRKQAKSTNVASDEKELETDLLKQLMDLTIKLEAEARDLMLESMDKGIPRTLLLADRNVQVRDVKAIRGDDANMLAIWRGVDQDEQDEQLEQLSRVRHYRNTFAEILVIGSILQRFQGDEQTKFERTRTIDPDEIEERDIAAGEEAQDLNRIADEQFDGITSRMFRRQMKRVTSRSRSRSRSRTGTGTGTGRRSKTMQTV